MSPYIVHPVFQSLRCEAMGQADRIYSDPVGTYSVPYFETLHSSDIRAAQDRGSTATGLNSSADVENTKTRFLSNSGVKGSGIGYVNGSRSTVGAWL